MIVAFWHVAQMNHWKSLVEEQSAKLACIPRVVVGTLGDETLSLPSEFEVSYQSSNLKEFEYPTLDLLWEHCQRHAGYVLYCHTKGASYGPELWDRVGAFWQELGVRTPERLFTNIREWRLYMEHFLIDRRERCWDALKAGHDTCGVSFCPRSYTGLGDGGFVVDNPHYQGNFWWAKTSYIRTLPKPSEYNATKGYRDAERAAAEFWVGSGHPKAANLWSTKHNFYRWGIPGWDYLPIHL